VSDIDLLGLGALAAGAVTGALTGALRQAMHLLALGLSGLLAAALGPRLAGPFSRALPDRGLGPPAAAFAVFALSFVLLSLAGHLLLRARGGEGRRSPADRGLGALLGGAQAAVGVWAVLSLWVVWDRPLGGKGLRLDPRQSDLAAFAREHNLLDAVLPAQLRQLRERLPAVREALERGALDRTAEAAKKAREALEQAEKAARDSQR
jgi:membrane protein required for colicin V production